MESKTKVKRKDATKEKSKIPTTDKETVEEEKKR